MIYVLLGMHKSGTSLVARILQESGISMCEEYDETRSYDKGGKGERLATKEVNKLLLGQATHSLSRKPGELLVTEETVASIRETIEAVQSGGGDWGFKDPRTCYTYGVWAEHLPDHRLIAVYRSPVEVWARYRSRKPLRLWAVLRSWASYNRAVLDILETTAREFLLLRFEALMAGDEEMKRLSDFIDAPLRDARKKEWHRAKATRALSVSLVGGLMGLTGIPRPGRVFRDLERLRRRQIGARQKREENHG